MVGINSPLGSAQVRWNDYTGTAAADDAEALLNKRSLYEIAGLDRDQWAIVGIDFSIGTTSEPLVVYARDRSADPEGAVAVTAFSLGQSVQLDQFLKEAFERVSVRLLSSAVSDMELLVTDQARLAAGPE